MSNLRDAPHPRQDAFASGRLAGSAYLVVVATGLFSLAYVPGVLGVPGDSHATLARMSAHLPLFRSGIAAFIAMQLAFLLLPFLLYRLFAQTDRALATAMVVLAVASVPLGLAALAHRIDALTLLTDLAVGRWLAPGQRQASAASSLVAYRNGLLVTQLFWGLWLLPLGWLVVRSRRLPRVLGVLLICGCAGYLVQVFGTVLSPAYPDSAFADYVSLPGAVGEIGTCLWLLILGARPSIERNRA